MSPQVERLILILILSDFFEADGRCLGEAGSTDATNTIFVKTDASTTSALSQLELNSQY